MVEETLRRDLVRRTLDFRTWDDLVRDVETLHEHGYQRVGNWSLAQICGHLADWMSFPLDGSPPMAFPMRLVLWALRHTIGVRERRRRLATRSMPSGWKTLPSTVHPPSDDEAAAVERLRHVVARFKTHTAPLHPSPLYGDMNREEWTQLQLIHAAHHLSFLIPKFNEAHV
jgi:hypothetical protein